MLDDGKNGKTIISMAINRSRRIIRSGEFAGTVADVVADVVADTVVVGAAVDVDTACSLVGFTVFLFE